MPVQENPASWHVIRSLQHVTAVHDWVSHWAVLYESLSSFPAAGQSKLLRAHVNTAST